VYVHEITVYILYWQRHSHVNSYLTRLARGVVFFPIFDMGSSPTRETSFSSCEDCIYVSNHVFFVQYQCLNMYKELPKIIWLAVIIYDFTHYAFYSFYSLRKKKNIEKYTQKI